jgi:hypothetical protein
MIFWRGWGIAVLGLTFPVLILTQLGVDGLFGDERYY